MVVLDGPGENYIKDAVLLEEDLNLQEERRRTGRYLAAGIVIFLVVLGLYHAVPDGSTRLLSLLGAALIMFLYLLWLLYSSKRKKRLLKVSVTYYSCIMKVMEIMRSFACWEMLVFFV
ncbi:hypothetical protein JTB14_012427 [Gonioctena quinquepunctata]|nr:hypothetical protein JTB14_012427 [Gonioctena quinquepunctata]